MADELADVIIAADLVASELGIDLGQAVADKFNATSRKHGMATLIKEGRLEVEIRVDASDQVDLEEAIEAAS